MRKFIFAYIILLLCFLSTLKRTTDTLQQDAVYKFVQILDWQHQGFSTFKRYIPENSADPWRKFQVYKSPFVYQTNDQDQYLVFPWLFNVLTTPFYLILGFAGLIFIPILFGVLSIWAFYKFIGKITDSNDIKNLSCYFYIICTPIVIYSSTLYEATLCNFLLYSSLFLFLENQEKREKNLYFFLAGVTIGLLIFFRAEVFFLGNLFILFFILQNIKKNLKATIFYSLGILFMLIFFVVGNQFLFDSYLPLRAISITNYSISYRFFRILDYIAFKPYSFLFYFPLCFSGIYFFFSKNKKFYLKFLFPLWIFFFLLPIIAPQQQGMDMTPRFFFPIVPILGFFSILFISEKFPKRKKWFYFYLFSHSAAFIFVMMFYVRIGNLSANAFKKKMTPFLVEHNIFQSNIFTLFSFYKDREKNYYLAQNVDENEILLDKIKEKKEKVRLFFVKNEVNKLINFNFTFMKKIYEDEFIYIFEPF